MASLYSAFWQPYDPAPAKISEVTPAGPVSPESEVAKLQFSNIERKQYVKIHFKQSPLFTQERRQVIQHEIDGFYKYLVSVGFRLAKELPPLGVRSTMVEVRTMPGSIYDDQINLPESGIDQPDIIRRVYANRLFRTMFGTWGHGLKTASIFVDYYLSSFSQERPNDAYAKEWPPAKWVNALWDLRTEFSQDFADRLLFYVAALWLKPDRSDSDFDEFFKGRFLAGLHVIDNAEENKPKVLDILKISGIQ